MVDKLEKDSKAKQTGSSTGMAAAASKKPAAAGGFKLPTSNINVEEEDEFDKEFEAIVKKQKEREAASLKNRMNAAAAV
jgi:hypothetical protein